MNVKEFKAWFVGFSDGVGQEGLDKRAWQRLQATIDILEEPVKINPIPKNMAPCPGVRLTPTPEEEAAFAEYAKYPEGSFGDRYSKIAADILK